MTSLHGPTRVVGLATAFLALTLHARGVQDRQHSLATVAAPDSSSTHEAQSTATEEEVRTRCTACHKLPPPDILPRAAWRDEMVRMMLIPGGRARAGGREQRPAALARLAAPLALLRRARPRAARRARAVAGAESWTGTVRKDRGVERPGERRRGDLERAPLRRRS